MSSESAKLYVDKLIDQGLMTAEVVSLADEWVRTSERFIGSGKCSLAEILHPDLPFAGKSTEGCLGPEEAGHAKARISLRNLEWSQIPNVGSIPSFQMTCPVRVELGFYHPQIAEGRMPACVVLNDSFKSLRKIFELGEAMSRPFQGALAVALHQLSCLDFPQNWEIVRGDNKDSYSGWATPDVLKKVLGQ